MSFCIDDDDTFYDSFDPEEEWDSSKYVPLVGDWEDVLPTYENTKFTMDSAKTENWIDAQTEIEFIRSNLHGLCRKKEGVPANEDDVMDFVLGGDSEFAKCFMEGVGFEDKRTYFEFMQTICLQASCSISTATLYDTFLPLKNAALFCQEKLFNVWKTIANDNKMDDQNYHGHGRRPVYLWEKIEAIANAVLRKLSIECRNGKVKIAIDDDKVWVRMGKNSLKDTRGLKYAHHVRDNRKGLIAHTAGSTGANIPFGIKFERKGDSATSCYKSLLDGLFNRIGGLIADLKNIFVAQDRGYMKPLIISYLRAAGAMFTGTTMRIVENFPFTFNQKVSNNDKRKVVDHNGAPCLFVKRLKKKRGDVGSEIYASAFRNGSGKVSTAISSIHRNHHWEGVARNLPDVIAYQNEILRAEMQKKAISRIESLGFSSMSQEETDAAENIITKVKPITLEQGM
jgi:hypothetical protein